MALAASERPYGPYLLCEELGRGGMAVVYRAISRKPESYGRVVALKQLLTDNEFDVDFDVVRSFIEEARLATRFRHANIANTYSLAKVHGTYCIEMEYVRGPTLLEIARQAETAGAVPIPLVAQILMQICDALEHVHGMSDDRGDALELVHRDVSLSNIIVGHDGIAKLIDFGIVKGHSCLHTEAGTIKGKAAYIAPEYLTGALDRRADLFALGAIAHELLTGRRLFLGKNDLDTITNVRELRVPPPSRYRADVPAALDAIVMRALARDPDQRWQTAAELRAALRALYGDGDPAQIRDWIAWACDREPPKVSQLLRVIDSLEQPTSIAIDLETQLVDETPVERGPRRAALLLAAVVSAAASLVLAGAYLAA